LPPEIAITMKPSLPDDFAELLDRPVVRRRAWRFILPAIVGLVLLVAGVTVKQGYFVRRAQLDFYAPTADGVAIGTRIKLMGFPIGVVSAVQFIPASAGQARRVKFEARIDAEYLAHIPSGSGARLTQEGVIGERIIEILPGTDSARPMASGESIVLATGGGLADLAATVETRVLPVADEARVLLRTLNDEQSGVKPLIADFRAVTGEVAATVQQAGKVLNRVDAKVDRILGEGEATLKSAHALANTAERRSAELLDDAHATLKNMRAATADGADMVREMRGAAPGLIAEGQSVAGDVSDMARSARRSWLMRLFVEEPVVESIGVDTGRLPATERGPAK
jgi:ABC-type transporter Mla subunit MlaD